MTATETLNKIKEALGLSAQKTELAQMKLEDGAVLEADAFEAGNEVFIVTEEDRIAVPVGEYPMENGQVLVVEEEGVIASIRDAAEEEESEEELKEDKMEYASKEELAEVKSAIDELRQAIEAMKPEEKEEMSEEPKEEAKEGLSADSKDEKKEEPKVELSEEFVHSPEASIERKLGFKLGARAKRGTQDVIFDKLFG